MDGDEAGERMELTSVVDAGSRREHGVEGVKSEESGESDPIVRAIRSGERREAIALCVREHGAALGRLCMALVGDRAEADELSQETLLAAHASLDAWRGDGSVRAWLFGIARKQCARHLEKQRRQTAKLRLVVPGEAPSAEELVAFRQRADQARAALERVKPTEREAIVLRYVGQLTFAEVAEACGIDEPAARKRVSRAILRLRAELGEAE